MSKAKVIAALLAVSGFSPAADENPDMEFLEWLGQVSEIEEMGVDIDSLMESQAADTEQEDSGDTTQEQAE